MNELELHAYGKIAQTLAEIAYRFADNQKNAREIASRFPDVQPPIWEHALAFYESLTRALWSLRILRPLDETPRRWAYHFVFECSVEEADQIAERNWQNGPDFHRLLEIFVDFVDGYFKEGYDFSSAALMPFGRNGRLTGVPDALVAIGYVEKTDEGYIWADIEPVMRILYGFKSFSDPEAFKPRRR
jgi:hypothetical protein